MLENGLLYEQGFSVNINTPGDPLFTILTMMSGPTISIWSFSMTMIFMRFIF